MRSRRPWPAWTEVIAGGTGVEVWGSDAWRELAVSWLDQQLAATGIRRTSGIEQPHLRPWATALRAPTTHVRCGSKPPHQAPRSRSGSMSCSTESFPTGCCHRSPAMSLAAGSCSPTAREPRRPAHRNRSDRRAGDGHAAVRAAATRPRAARRHAAGARCSRHARRRRHAGPVRPGSRRLVRMWSDAGTGADRAAFEQLAPLRATCAEWCEQLACQVGKVARALT